MAIQSLTDLKALINSTIQDNTTNDISGSDVQTALINAIDTLDSLEGFINVHKANGQTTITAYGSKALARAAVPDDCKKEGVVIAYKISTGWLIEQNLDATAGTWGDDASWQTIGPVSVSQNTSKGGYDLFIGNDSKNVAANKEIVLRSLINPDEAEIGRINEDGTISTTGGDWRVVKLYLNAGTYWLRCPRTWSNRPQMYKYTDDTYNTPLAEIVPNRGRAIDERVTIEAGYYAICWQTDGVTDWTLFLVNCNIIDGEPVEGSPHIITSGGVFDSIRNYNKYGVLASSDLNDVKEIGTYLLIDSNTYQNTPNNKIVGFLRVSNLSSNWVLQEFFDFTSNEFYKRRTKNSSSCEKWLLVSCNYRQLDEITAKISEMDILTANDSIDNKFLNDNAQQVSNTSFRIDKYNVTGGNNYMLTAQFAAGTSIYFIYWYDENDNFISRSPLKGSTSVETSLVNELVIAPDNASYCLVNVEKSRYSQFGTIASKIPSVLSVRARGVLPSSDLDSIKTSGVWCLVDSNTYTHTPNSQTAGFLRVSVGYENRFIIQEFFDFSGNGYYKRTGFGITFSWENWVRLDNTGTVINNTFNEYEQTVNLTATPQITTDTNNYLASTGDNTDRTADILAMLQATGMCHLGVGDFYIDSLVMPDDSTIVGCGCATKVHLIAGNNKFAISMKKRNLVKDLLLIGSESSITPNATVGTRHGILWQGNYTQEQSGVNQPQFGMIDNVWIWDFQGGGITCYDTGYATYNHLSVVNCDIKRCDVGLNIAYWSEFHKFTNVRCQLNYYGCINNGGNNVFVNCDFSDNLGVAFLMDNSQGQSINNSHGSCVGCVFNHTANNTGIGIKVLNCDSGFIFTGCQIFYSQIDVEDSDGVEFANCNFGKNNCNITINGGGVVLFIANLHQDTPPSITITNNTKVHFVNCYNRSTGATIEP